MHIETLRTRIGISFILIHFAALGYVFIGLRTTLKPAQTLQLALILSPLFTAYTTSIIKKFLAEPHNFRKGKRVSTGYAFVAIFFPVVFGVAVFLILYLYHTGEIAKPEDMNQYVAACEALAGCYLGLVMGNLFDAPPKPSSGGEGT